MSLTQKVRLGLRRETVIVFPVVVLLLALVSIFTLQSYRRAILDFVDSSREDVRLSAARLNELFSGNELPPPEVLRAVAPQAVRLSLLDTSGFAVYSRGIEIGGDPLAGLSLENVDEATVGGPTTDAPFVSALAPVNYRGRRHFLRLDVDAATHARQLASLRQLTWVVAAANVGLTVLALLFLRHLLTPYDRLIARAREILPASQSVEDEVTLLVSSFERAVEAIQHPESVVDELAALERALGPSLESGLLLVDEERQILAINPAGLSILDLEAIPTPSPLSSALSAHRDLQEVIAAAVEERRTVQRREIETRNREGIRLLGLSVHPLRRNDGSIRAYLVLFADLTETRREAEAERLATSLEQVGEMAAGIAHEMRNSLATFRGYLTLIEKARAGDAVDEYLSELRREADHLHRVLEDFLSFAKPGSTRLERMDVGGLVARATRDPLLRGLKIELRSRDAMVHGDAELLERALRNLLLNAQQAMAVADDVQPVTVAVERQERQVVIRIADRGPGLPADIRGALFQPFVTGRSGGVGLGLALAHRIVQLHGGRLDLRDRSGGGAVATIELPLAPEPAISSDSGESPRDRVP